MSSTAPVLHAASASNSMHVCDNQKWRERFISSVEELSCLFIRMKHVYFKFKVSPLDYKLQTMALCETLQNTRGYKYDIWPL